MEKRRVLVSTYFTVRWTLTAVPTGVFGWLGTVTTEFVSEQEVSSFSKVKFTKFLTLVEIVRLGPVKGTKGWLRCGRSDLTLRRGKWRGVFYRLVSFWTLFTIRIRMSRKSCNWQWLITTFGTLWSSTRGSDWRAGYISSVATNRCRLGYLRNIHSLCMEGNFLYEDWKWLKRILAFSLLQLLNLVGPFTLEPTREFFHQTLQFGRVLKNLQIWDVFCG